MDFWVYHILVHRPILQSSHHVSIHSGRTLLGLSKFPHSPCQSLKNIHSSQPSLL